MENTIKTQGYYIQKIEVVDNDTYIGHGKMQLSDDSNEWIIKKINVTNALTTITYSVGSWTNRVTLIYC